MKQKNSFLLYQWHTWSIMLIVFLVLPSCAVTDTVVSRHLTDEPTRAHTLSHVGATHWSYFWGLLKAADWDAGCQPGSDMTRVRTRTNPLFISVSFLSLGLVIPQKLEWDCAPPTRDTGVIGND
ncbi:hypothetical protein FVR03_16710 [Pontibacter qinzhouensis]|uniref:Uncharacterized protein n=1 Tax=Pontibacter qinzhouensis TaxID=2603253 RepID=A0A5C8JEI8_9BACT|nr:hypothetical protein [Pontibacter qinzhouensis]TXK36865.1 hypothetical protein FVR03_16710 [Pontibacter qinzhouensis]